MLARSLGWLSGWACLAAVPALLARAQDADCDATCHALRDAQDPLADVRAIMTENTIAFGTTDDETSYGFQIQPVYSSRPKRGSTSLPAASSRSSVITGDKTTSA